MIYSVKNNRTKYYVAQKEGKTSQWIKLVTWSFLVMKKTKRKMCRMAYCISLNVTTIIISLKLLPNACRTVLYTPHIPPTAIQK